MPNTIEPLEGIVVYKETPDTHPTYHLAHVISEVRVIVVKWLVNYKLNHLIQKSNGSDFSI
jgi:hypothetical protein